MHSYSYILSMLLYASAVFPIGPRNYRSIASSSYPRDILDIYPLGSRTIASSSRLPHSTF